VQQIILTDCHWSIGIHWSHHGHILTAPSWELLEVARPEVLHESLPGDIKNHIFLGIPSMTIKNGSEENTTGETI
jgi:hypothetical protein